MIKEPTCISHTAREVMLKREFPADLGRDGRLRVYFYLCSAPPFGCSEMF